MVEYSLDDDIKYTISFVDEQLTKVSEINKRVDYLILSNNNITKLENIPRFLEYLDVSNNNIIKLENLPTTLYNLNIINNPLIDFFLINFPRF